MMWLFVSLIGAYTVRLPVGVHRSFWSCWRVLRSFEPSCNTVQGRWQRCVQPHWGYEPTGVLFMICYPAEGHS